MSGLILKKMEIDKRREFMKGFKIWRSTRGKWFGNGRWENVDSDQKHQFREDYLKAMQLSFLNGEADKDFDYSKIDVSDALDSR